MSDMSEKEYRVLSYRTYVKQSEIKLREARLNLEEGYKKLKAEFEREYNKLKFDVEKAQADLERDKLSLQLYESERDRGFDTT